MRGKRLLSFQKPVALAVRIKLAGSKRPIVRTMCEV
jgi:hypothetical protein